MYYQDMKKNYVLITGILILILVGGYFGVQKITHNQNEIQIEKKQNIKKNKLKTNKIQYRTEYDNKTNTIFFYDNKELINSFSIDLNSPFNKKNRSTINSKNNTYSLIDEDLNDYNFSELTKSISILDGKLSYYYVSFFDDSASRNNIAISYFATSNIKESLNSEKLIPDIAFSVVLILDNRGNIIEELKFPNEHFLVKSVSENSKYLFGESYSNLELKNDYPHATPKLYNSETRKNEFLESEKLHFYKSFKGLNEGVFVNENLFLFDSYTGNQRKLVLFNLGSHEISILEVTNNIDIQILNDNVIIKDEDNTYNLNNFK